MSRKPLSEKEYKNIRKLLKRDKKKKGSKNSRVAKLTNRSAETVRVIGHFDTYFGYLNRKNAKKDKKTSKLVKEAIAEIKKPTVTFNAKIFRKDVVKTLLENSRSVKKLQNQTIANYDSILDVNRKTSKEISELNNAYSDLSRAMNNTNSELRKRVNTSLNQADNAKILAALSMGLLIFYVVASWFIGLN